MKTILAIGLLICLSQPANAQLFRRQSSNVTPSQGSHWGYPGSLSQHLATTHGQSVAGLSHAQLLELHDALHEGRSVSKQVVVRKQTSVIVTQRVTQVAKPSVKQNPAIIVW